MPIPWKRGLMALLALAAFIPLAATELRSENHDRPIQAQAIVPSDYYTIELCSTLNSRGASGSVVLSFPPSPFGVRISKEGRYIYDMHVEVRGIPSRIEGSLVVWIATPNLDQVEKIGTMASDGTAVGRVDLSKFMVFVTREIDVSLDRWAGPILLQGISRSGMMQSMEGHSTVDYGPC